MSEQSWDFFLPRDLVPGRKYHVTAHTGEDGKMVTYIDGRLVTEEEADDV